jgi:lipopolysaccharide transport system permease protein
VVPELYLSSPDGSSREESLAGEPLSNQRPGYLPSVAAAESVYTTEYTDSDTRTLYSHFIQLWKRRELLFLISWRDIKVRYRQTVMGFLWALLMPATVTLAGLILRSLMLNDAGPSVLDHGYSIMVKALAWSFFVGAVRNASSSLIGNANLISKSNFPREVLPLSAVLSQCVDLLAASAVVGVIITLSPIELGPQLLWMPFLFCLLIALTAGLALFISAANLFFRDVKYLVELGLTFGIFFTPVLFESNSFGTWGVLFYLNPLTPIMDGLVSCTLRQQSPGAVLVLAATAASFGLLFAGYRCFKSLDRLFVERL